MSNKKYLFCWITPVQTVLKICFPVNEGMANGYTPNAHSTLG